MQNLSLKKISIAIVGIIALFHLDEILDFIRAVFHWFGDSLALMHNFPDDAQAAIAFCTIILIVVIISKTINRKR